MILSELMSLNDRKLKTLIKSARNINNVPSFCTFYPCIFDTAKKILQQRKIHSNCCSSRNMISYSFLFFFFGIKSHGRHSLTFKLPVRLAMLLKPPIFPFFLTFPLNFMIDFSHSTLTDSQSRV